MMRNVRWYVGLGVVMLLVVICVACAPQEAKQPQTVVEQPRPKETVFQTGNLVISPTPAIAGQSLFITASVINVGDESGSYNAVLSVDGQLTESRDISILPGQRSIVEFTINNLTAGKHTIAIGESVLSIDVLPEPIRMAFLRDYGGHYNWEKYFRSEIYYSWEICTMDPDGTNIERITKNTTEDLHPTWSPDGTKISFQSIRESHGLSSIYVMDANGMNVKCLTPELKICRFPVWSPDGKKIAYCVMKGGKFCGSMGQGGFSGKEILPDAIYIMNPDGSGKMKVSGDWCASLCSCWCPSWFPDSQQVAFASNYSGMWGIYSKNINSTEVKKLITLPKARANQGLPVPSSEFPVLAVSPDGSSIALAYYDYSPYGRQDIYVLTLDTGELRNLTSNCDGRCYSPTWSPDSKKIAFTVEKNDDISIYVINVDGSNMTKLIENGSWPAWQSN